MAIIDNVQILTNSDNTQLLELLINQCKTIATDYCGLDVYDEDLDDVIELMVIERFNRLSAEGISSQSYSGISENYNDDFSPVIYKSLNKHRKLQTLRSTEDV